MVPTLPPNAGSGMPIALQCSDPRRKEAMPPCLPTRGRGVAADTA
jgi:hypothetical protein